MSRSAPASATNPSRVPFWLDREVFLSQAKTPSGKLMSVPAHAATQMVAPAKARQSLSAARLCRHADYQRAYAASRKRQSASMSWFLAPQPDHTVGPRVGLTVGKVLGKAHERNRIKRRMREILRRHLDLLPAGCDLILHPRRLVLTAEFTKLDAEVVRILQQASAEAARRARPAAAKPAV